MSFNPWAARFAKSWTDEAIDAIVEVLASPPRLQGLAADPAAEVVRVGLEKIFVSGEQARQVLRIFIDIAFVHATSHFISEKAYAHGLYEPDPWGGHAAPAICFTGLAGTGKSALFIALRKLLGPPASVDIPGHGDIPLIPGWFLTVKDGTDLKRLLTPCAMPDGSQSGSADQDWSRARRIATSDLLKLSRRQAWRDGVCFIGVDEFQFITLGSVANARATSVLLNLLGLGPRLVYIANYSLVHRLRKRGHEDRDRLLQRPVVLWPEACSSPDWIRLLTEFKKLCPEVFIFDVDNVQEDIHRFTFGLKRSVVRLLVAAVRESRNKGNRIRVDEDALRRAYLSQEYSACREDVEILVKQQIQRKCLRQDLWCPFSGEDNSESVLVASRAVQDFNRKVDEDYLKSSLLPNEAAAFNAIQAEHVKDRPRGKVVSMPRQKVTAELLLEGSRQFDKGPR
ncbi:hypothetical protein DSC91_000111 [Paraburkholderia caffeinilytica]|uniref:AAA+ ATPase domain-containing protein n=1 Tax=Paraburkholderia caffeinilytica TaxID=1761016 RepID=A0ABQ1NDX5_9BURK|nr:hypothetical protein [Paraburkholderia caffeinilytica]AXL48637.1 hypothetical protein DSC91_000111 [Paraburkholderia caffeinilytica]GGC62830.1 hypothetical protein GCM10011400_58340 [Paraburkholderia caffeinilytica]CAB3798145.1 hypothetical protein LMG28690_04680 [Paraburkholderia caffeinilytica]